MARQSSFFESVDKNGKEQRWEVRPTADMGIPAWTIYIDGNLSYQGIVFSTSEVKARFYYLQAFGVKFNPKGKAPAWFERVLPLSDKRVEIYGSKAGGPQGVLNYEG